MPRRRAATTRALQIRDMGDPVKEHLVFGGNDAQPCLHELSVPEWRPQHLHTLLVKGQGAIASPEIVLVVATHLAAPTSLRREDSQKEAVGAVHRILPWLMDADVDHQCGLCRPGDDVAHSRIPWSGGWRRQKL